MNEEEDQSNHSHDKDEGIDLRDGSAKTNALESEKCQPEENCNSNDESNEPEENCNSNDESNEPEENCNINDESNEPEENCNSNDESNEPEENCNSNDESNEPEENCNSNDESYEPEENCNSNDESDEEDKPKIPIEPEELSNEGKTADQTTERDKMPSRHQEGELFKRTMVALSRSEVYSKFLTSKINATRTQLTPEQEEDSTPEEKKRKRSSSPEEENSSKKQKGEVGESVPVEKPSKRQPKLLEGAVLRDYQMEGLDWLMALDVSGASGILADEMGLGKTIQVIALVSFLIEMKSSDRPFLVLGPLSTVTNWMNEFKRFAPKIPVVVYYGKRECRVALRWELKREHVVDGMRTYPVVITSYNIPLSDTYLRSISWRYLIVDEGHRLKNHKCKLIQELRRYETVSRLLLTGTPLQNNLTELWSLLNFILPEIVDDQLVFESWFDEEELSAEGSEKILEAEKKNQVLSTLHRILKPFLLRRVKADVNLNLPPKCELIVYAPLTPMQKKLYNFLFNRVLELSEKAKKTVDSKNIIEGKRRRRRPSNYGEAEKIELSEERESDNGSKSVNNAISKLLKRYISRGEELKSNVKDGSPDMNLRKVCQHPYLVSFPVSPGTTMMAVDERLVSSSGKLQVLDALLKRLHVGGHKVLIFSTFTSMLDILEDYLIIRGYKYSRLDGGRNLDNRKVNIDSFNDNSDVFVFLISTRAGGLGINLVAADTVIIFDSDWNPQVDLQAQDRCHRIGQTRPVVVYRLIVDGTIDEKLIEKAESKMRLDKLVIGHGKFRSIHKNDTLNTKDIESLLEFKDRHIVRRPKGEVLTSAELDILCNRDALFGENALSQDGLFKIIKGDQMKAIIKDNNVPQESS